MDYLLVLLMSFDALLACMALGAKHITAEPCARLVIAGVGTGCLALSLLCARALGALLPRELFHLIGCGTLLILALCCLFEEGCKRLSALFAARTASLTLRLHSLRIVLQIYAETTEADTDRSGTLSPSEALLLALPLSLDSLLTGLSISATAGKAFFILGLSFVCGLAASAVGEWLGKRIGRAAGQSATLVSGILLLIVAVWKFKL